MVVSVAAVACGSGSDGDAAPVTDSASRPATVPADASGSDTPASPGGRPDSVRVFVIPNQGGVMEGHTPRGFRGSGTGLFAGDNLNPSFPNGDGVQTFLTFDLATVPNGEVASAVLKSDAFVARGTPFEDLGALNAAEIRYEQFSPDLWNAAPTAGGAACVFARSPGGPFECDLSPAVQRSLDDGYRYAQFRLRFDSAGDGDGSADLAAFFRSNSNTNEPGLFELSLELTPTTP